MTRWIYYLLTLLIFAKFPLIAYTDSFPLKPLKNYLEAYPGETLSIPIQLTNPTDKPFVFRGELDLPPGWKILANHQIIDTLPPRQTRIYSLVIMIPHEEKTREFELFYNARGMHRSDIKAVTGITIFVKPSCSKREECKVAFQDEKKIPTKLNEPLLIDDFPSFKVFPPDCLEIKNEELFYFSVVYKNETEEPETGTLKVILPLGWSSFPSDQIPFDIHPGQSLIKIFGIKSSRSAIAGTYPIRVEFKGREQREKFFLINITPSQKIHAVLENATPLQCNGNDIDLVYHFRNEGNSPINVQLETGQDPICRIKAEESAFHLSAYESKRCKIQVWPTVDEDFQFVFIKVSEKESGTVIFQDTLRIETQMRQPEKNDSLLRIPSLFTTYYFKERCDSSFAVEFEGGGVIDPDKDRYLEFYLCSPSGSAGAVFNLEETYYLNISEPSWNATFGDSIYELTPLTQGFQYGTGASFNYNGKKWCWGGQYSENSYCGRNSLKQSGAFLGFMPNDNTTFSTNWLLNDWPRSKPANLISLEGEMLTTNGGTFDIELGFNCNTSEKASKKLGYRIYLRDKFRDDIWYDFETIYAGPYFPGYYENCTQNGFTLDSPFFKDSRINLSYTTMDLEEIVYSEKKNSRPYFKQKQLNSTISYTLGPRFGGTFYGTYLRAFERRRCEFANFKQYWLGSSFWVGQNNYWCVAMASLGAQKDYVKRKTEAPLQNYYFLTGKEWSPNLFTSFSFETGNVDYYDADKWRNVFTASLRYRYTRGSFLELLVQQTKEHCDNFIHSQAIINLEHRFKNGHQFLGSFRYFREKRHHNEFCLMLSYTIPLDIPVGKRTDIGSVTGEIYDIHNNTPVQHAIVNLSGRRIETGKGGEFKYQGISPGKQLIKAETLPPSLVGVDAQAQEIYISGGKPTHIRIPVTPSCSLEGTILVYDQISLSPFGIPEESENFTVTKGAEGVRVVFENIDSKEIYNTFTDRNGNFSFLLLRPGKWRISLHPSELPPHHYLEYDTLEVELKPLEKKNLAIKILPKIRQMKPLNAKDLEN